MVFYVDGENGNLVIKKFFLMEGFPDKQVRRQVSGG